MPRLALGEITARSRHGELRTRHDGRMGTMRAWELGDTAKPGKLRLVEKPIPSPGTRELLVRITASAVCRTDLHIVDGDLPLHKSPVTPGHQVVGEVVAGGEAVTGWDIGQRAGIAWLRHTDGRCVYCRRGSENLCPQSLYTGWDADGGYAEYATVPADFAYRLPPNYPDEQVAPLLCAGIIGYRALLRARVPSGGRLGIYGFGASAHLAAQVALAQGARVHVVTRSVAAQQLALELGATVGRPLVPFDSAILFAPVGELVPPALAALDRGGTLAIAGIHLTDIPSLSYERHLFEERTLTSVTANTRTDGNEFLDFAARHPIRVRTTLYPLAEADKALMDLAEGRVQGAAVLKVGA